MAERHGVVRMGKKSTIGFGYNLEIPLMPSWFISLLTILGGLGCLLCVIVFRHKLPTYLMVGLSLLFPALFSFGILYFYITDLAVNFYDLLVRQRSVRLLMVYMFGAIDVFICLIFLYWRKK